MREYPKISATDVPLLYHGTNSASDIENHGIKVSCADAGSCGISRFVWFHENVIDAASYCIFSSHSSADCDVLVYRYSGDLPMIDLRNTSEYQIRSLRNEGLLSDALATGGFGGVLISPTVSGVGDEWGISDPSTLLLQEKKVMPPEWYEKKSKEAAEWDKELAKMQSRKDEMEELERSIRAKKS